MKVKKSKLIKEQEASGIIRNLTGIKERSLSDLTIWNIKKKKHKINSVTNNLLLAGDKFMPGIF